LEPMLRATAFASPDVQVIANVDAAPVTDGETACDRLGRQVDSPVRWVDSVHAMVADFGVESFIEMGPGSVLSGLARRIEGESSQLSLAEPENFEKLLAAREDVT